MDVGDDSRQVSNPEETIDSGPMVPGSLGLILSCRTVRVIDGI